MTLQPVAIALNETEAFPPRRGRVRSTFTPRLLVLLPVVFVLATFGMATAVFVWSGFSAGRLNPTVGLTLANYRTVLGDPYNWHVLLDTTRMSLIVVVFTAVISYPLAMAITRNRGWWGEVFFAVVLISSTMSLVIRALGWIGFLDTNGVLNSILMTVGVISEPMRILGSESAVIIGLVHGFVPLLTLTLVPVLQNIDPTLEAAAAGLGAQRWEQLWRITLPLSAPGLISGSFLVFAMSMGAYTTPAILGGGKSITFPELIQQQVSLLMDYPTGAVLAITLMLVVLLTVAFAAAGMRSRFPALGG